MKPIIGIVGRVIERENDTTIICCFEDIRKSVLRNGGNPIMILPSQNVNYDEVNPKLTEEEIEDLKQQIDLCDGIIMPGTTKLYYYDQVIYEYAFSKDIPILGICGGMQLIAINDRAEIEDKVLYNINSNIKHNQPDVDNVHKVTINEDSILYNIMSKSEICVNSRHNQAVNHVNKLKVSAISEDGLIEGIEYSDKKFVIGVQWHPENLSNKDIAENNIFKKFIEACYK